MGVEVQAVNLADLRREPAYPMASALVIPFDPHPITYSCVLDAAQNRLVFRKWRKGCGCSGEVRLKTQYFVKENRIKFTILTHEKFVLLVPVNICFEIEQET